MKLIDTSVLVECLRRGVFEEGAISVVTLLEVLRGVDPGKRIAVKELLEKSFRVLGLTNDVIVKYCEIYSALKREGAQIPDADLLIAATALANNLELVTRDKDFERLRKEGLKLELKII